MPDPLASLDPRRHAHRADLADLRLVGKLEAPRFVAGDPATVTGSALPLHAAPDAASMRNSEVIAGESVRVFDRAGAWAWVQSERDGYVGYVPADGIGTRAPTPTHRVVVPGTFVYVAPEIKSRVVAQIFLNTSLAIALEADGFARLSDDGPFAGAFAVSGHLGPVGRPAADFVAVAERFLDVPYLWGGITRLGLDCSGLVQTAMTAAGATCPRDSDMQREEVGERIDPDAGALRRGDLVFWRGHVGIMRDPETLLHANAYHMRVVAEPFEPAVRRIATTGSKVLAVRRPSAPDTVIA